MTPDLVVDIGNSRMKWGRCENNRVVESISFRHHDVEEWERAVNGWRLSPGSLWVVAGVVPDRVHEFTEWLRGRSSRVTILTSDLFEQKRTPIVTTVEQPKRIGVDRLLGALAAFHQAPAGVSAIAISVGTAMTMDLVTAGGEHVGGIILPGPQLMAKSLHDYTARLPLVEVPTRKPDQLWGTNTETAIQFGVAQAILGAADQMVRQWASRCDPPPYVAATGGDVGFFHGFTFTAEVHSFIIDPMLILEGIRLAAEALP